MSGHAYPIASGSTVAGGSRSANRPQVSVTRRAVRAASGGFACALVLPWALALRLRPILVALVVLDIPLQIDTNLGHLDAPAELGALGGFNVSLTTLALVGLYAGWLADRSLRDTRASRRMPARAITVGFALHLLVATLSVAAAYDAGLSYRGLFLMAQMFLLYLYLACTTRTRADVRFIAIVLAGALALESLIVAGLSVVGDTVVVGGLAGRVDAPSDGLPELARIGGTVGSPNDAAAFLAMLLAPALALLFADSRRAVKALAMVALASGSVALITTQSRGGWLAAIFSIALVCVPLFRRRIALRVPLTAVVFVLALGFAFRNTLATRLLGDDNGAAHARVPLMATAFRVIEDHPALGVGVNNYAAVLDRYASEHRDDFLYTVHNRYLLVWAETGPAGLLAFLWFLIATLGTGWEAWRRRDRLLSPLALGLTAAMAGGMVHMLVEVYNSRSHVQLVAVVAALIGAAARVPAEQSRQG